METYTIIHHDTGTKNVHNKTNPISQAKTNLETIRIFFHSGRATSVVIQLYKSKLQREKKCTTIHRDASTAQTYAENRQESKEISNKNPLISCVGV